MPSARPKLIFLVTEDWYFLSHRLPAARAALALGYDVAVATRVGSQRAAIEAHGIRVLPLTWQRRQAGPLALLGAIRDIARLYRRERPDLVHHIAIKPAVVGGLAAILAGVPAVATTLAGLGLALSPATLRAAVGRRLLKTVLRLVAAGRRSVVSVQNDNDRRVLAQGFPRVAPIVLIPGSGVDLDRFRPLPEPAGPVTCAQVSRMLTIKGVVELVGAVRRVRAEGIDLRLILAGTPDRESRATLTEATLEGWARDPAIRWLRHVADVRDVWSEAHIAVLASHGGEGVPKSLLEAAACGRPLVGTTVPGIDDLIMPGRNGLTVPPQDAAALAAALARLAGDAALRAEWGAAARASVDPDRGEAAVTRATAALYRALADTPAADAVPAQPG